MRTSFMHILAPSIVLGLAGLVLGCTVETGRPRRDAGPSDAPIPPGVDAPFVFEDFGPRPDRGPLPPADTDEDGLSDDDEAARGTNPLVADSDGDGQDDGVEVIAGTDPLNAGSFIPGTDFYVVLPYLDPELHRELDFRARLGRADIFFLVDTTASMGIAIGNVRSSLSTVIVPAARDAIADVVMGVGDYRDFPIDPYGSPASGGFAADWPFVVRQTMTGDIPSVQAALNLLMAGGGNDEPESGTEGLFHAVADPCPVPDGGFGAACFRTMSHPIIVLVTDAHLHNGPSPAYDYSGVPGARTWAETTAALVANDVRVVGVGVPILFLPAVNLMDLRTLASVTGSVDAAGGLTVYEAPGGNVSTSAVDGIVDLVGATTQDVTSVTRDEPTDAVDATQFITSVTPLRSSRPTTFDATTFYDVPGGTTITFDVTFQNDFLPPTSVVQIFRAYIDVNEITSMTTLDTRNVYIVVPPEGGILF